MNSDASRADSRHETSEFTVAAPLILGRPQGGQLAPPAAKNAPEVLFWK